MTSIPDYNCTLHGTHLPLRLDLALVAAFPHLSRRRIRRALDYGGIYLNRRRVRVASRLAFGGDRVEIFLTSSPQVAPQLQPDDIIYNDDQLLVINKPPCLLSQATRSQAVAHLIPAVQQLLPDCGALRIVHRLDAETSGAIMLARTRAAAVFLSQQLRQQRIAKQYLALCAGIPQWRKHTAHSHLSAINKHLGMVTVAEQDKPYARAAVTRFTVLATASSYPVTLLKCEPRSGRSHQIRAQLQQLGLPVLGDKKYGDTRPQLPAAAAALTHSHHLLHAYSLTLQPAPHSERITVQAQPPVNFGKILAVLGMEHN